jgi:uncharacterized repeat protein (TIGR04138 family)
VTASLKLSEKEEEEAARSLSCATGRSVEAYKIVMESLDLAIAVAKARNKGKRVMGVHACCLCNSVIEHVVETCGGLAWGALSFHGLTSTDAIGEVIYELIHANALFQERGDQQKDFTAIFDFSEAVKSRMEKDFARIGMA